MDRELNGVREAQTRDGFHTRRLAKRLRWKKSTLNSYIPIGHADWAVKA
jgi:hypothetical protein